MPPRKKPTPEENAAKAAKPRERRQNETPDVREKRLAQQREYNLAKRRRPMPTEPDGGAEQSDGRAAQSGLVQRVKERSPFPQTTEVLNDNDAAIVPVETETERAYREEFLNELRQQTRHNRRTIRTHRKAQEPVLFEANIPTHDCGRMDVKCGDCNALHFKKRNGK
jgi:hypothetical protein